MRKLVGGALLLLASPSEAAVTFGSAQVQATVTADVPGSQMLTGAGDLTTSIDQPPVALITRTNTGGGTTVTANAFLSGDFQSPTKGGFIIEDVSALRVPAPGATAGSASVNASFQYTFTSDSPFIVTYDFGVLFAGRASGGFGLYSTIDGNPVFGDEFKPGTSYTSAVIGPGEYFVDYSVFVAAGPNSGNDSSATGRISFLLTPAAVPESGTWALMIVGFGLVGGVMRRSGGPARRVAARGRLSAADATLVHGAV